MRVLVSGAGVAGPCFAYHLARAVPTAKIVVIEKGPRMSTQGQNIDINGSALLLVERMGLLPKMKELNTGELGAKFVLPSGRSASFPIGDGSRPSPTSQFEILRGDLANLLYEKSLSEYSQQIEYRFGTTIDELLENETDKPAKVKLSDGRIMEFDIVVAADGQWSRLRRHNFDPADVQVVDKGLYVAWMTIPRLETDDNWWYIYTATGSRNVSIRPDPHGTIRGLVTFMPSNDEQRQEWQKALRSDKAQQQDLVRRYFKGAGWQTERPLEAMKDAPDWYLQPVIQIRAKT